MRQNPEDHGYRTVASDEWSITWEHPRSGHVVVADADESDGSWVVRRGDGGRLEMVGTRPTRSDAIALAARVADRGGGSDFSF